MKNTNTYNKAQDTVAVISSYASKDDANKSAIDRYNKRKLEDLAMNHPVVICAEKKRNEPYNELYAYKHNIDVARVWEKGKVLSLFNMIKYIVRLPHVKTVLVEFEFNVFGGTLMNIALVAALFVLRLLGKHIVFELHQVITDVDKLEKHLNIRNSLLEFVYSNGIKAFFFAVGLVSNRVVVLEQELKDRLTAYVSTEKIHLIPHHMRLQKTSDKTGAKTKLGIPSGRFVVLVFGYLNWYKGVDWIIKAVNAFKGTNIHLLVAGGPNPYHMHKEYYRKYYDGMVKLMNANPNITCTGFVEEEDMDTVFSAADLMTLPYRVFMAASGPFSQALSYGVPVILSEKLADYMKSGDFTAAMRKTGLKKNDLFFPMRIKRVVSLISLLSHNAGAMDRLARFSKLLGKERSSHEVTKRFSTILFPSKQTVSTVRNSSQITPKINYT